MPGTAWASGVVATAYQDLIARCFPVDRRGRVLGIQTVLGFGAGALGSAFSAWLLRTFPFPTDFLYTFTVAATAITVSFLFLGLTREPVQPVSVPPQSNCQFWAGLPKILRRDHNYRHFLVARMLMAMGVMGVGFVFFRPPTDFLSRVGQLRAQLKARFNGSNQALQMSYLRFLADLRLALGSFLPLFLITQGKTGYVCLQVNPREHGDADAMIPYALSTYEDMRVRLGGGVPNVVFKLPGTRAGLEACSVLTKRGIGCTITVNFGLFQHLPFAQAIGEGKALTSYLVEMNGRLAYPVRDELLARLDELAGYGIDEAKAREAAAWAGVAVLKRLYKLLAERGYDLTRVRPLVASLRIYEGDGYENLPIPGLQCTTRSRSLLAVMTP